MNFSKLLTGGNILNIIKGVYRNPVANTEGPSQFSKSRKKKTQRFKSRELTVFTHRLHDCLDRKIFLKYTDEILE